MSSTNRQMFEGVGAPVNVDRTDGYIDPTLDSCCQREIESNRKRDAVETTLRAHDRVTKAEDQRRQYQQQPLLPGGIHYNEYNLLHNLSFGSGCRCCYDPNSDGGEYELLAEARRERGLDNIGDNGNVDEQDEKVDVQSNGSDSDSDSEFDYLLDEPLPGADDINDGLQSHRRAELENMARHAEIARYHGYGVHRQMNPRRVFVSAGYGADQVRDRVCPKGSVLHLYDAYSPLSVSLDLCLEEMATRYAGTKFVRGIGVTSILYAENGGDEWKRGDLPMLLAIRDGRVVVYSSGLRDFYRCGDDGVESKVVEQWLDNAGVLHTNLPSVDTLCRIRPEEEMLLENMRKLNGLGSKVGGGFGGMMGYMKGEMGRNDDDLEEEEQRYDCGLDGCNKCFFHEHVGVRTDAQDGLVVPESQVA